VPVCIPCLSCLSATAFTRDAEWLNRQPVADGVHTANIRYCCAHRASRLPTHRHWCCRRSVSKHAPSKQAARMGQWAGAGAPCAAPFPYHITECSFEGSFTHTSSHVWGVPHPGLVLACLTPLSWDTAFEAPSQRYRGVYKQLAQDGALGGGVGGCVALVCVRLCCAQS
jgi:hypothetical protein